MNVSYSKDLTQRHQQGKIKYRQGSFLQDDDVCPDTNALEDEAVVIQLAQLYIAKWYQFDHKFLHACHKLRFKNQHLHVK